MKSGITTERMVLRPITPEDAALLYELDRDPEVMRWLSGGPATPMGAIVDRILPDMVSIAGSGDGHGTWVANDRESRAFLGWFVLRPSENDGESEVGYRLRRAAWGHGLATEGVVAMLRRAFDEMGRERVFGTTYEENAGSRRVMEKAGMRHVRSFRLRSEDLEAGRTFESEPGEAWDGNDMEYAITRGEWLTRDKK
jgi:RimJ/RimL family protein N-acetyltransferase